MKKLIGLALWLVAVVAWGQTFPVNNLVVNGTSSFASTSTFSVSPTGPTPPIGDNSSSLATTAFIKQNYVPLTGLSGLAPINSPAFTGVPTAPTPAVGTNSNQVATMAAIVQHNTPCQSILDYGGNGTGTGNNDSAWLAVIAAQPANNVCVFFPQGTYNFSSQAAYTLPSGIASVKVFGAGAELSTLYWAGSGGMKFTYSSPFNHVSVRGLTFAAGGTGAGNGLTLTTSVADPNPANTALSDVMDTVFRGSDGYEVTNYWSIGVNIVSVPNVNFFNDIFVGSATAQGQGIHLSGTATANDDAFNIQQSFFNALNVGIYYDNYTQGVTVNQSNFTGVNQGILAIPGESLLDQLVVTASQFNCFFNCILIQTPMNGLMISNNFFLVQNNANGIVLQNVAQFTITGNTFNPAVGSPTGTIYVEIGSYTAAGGIIMGNQFYAGNLGVTLQAGSKGVSLLGNNYINMGTTWLNGSTSACPASASGNCVGTITP